MDPITRRSFIGMSIATGVGFSVSPIYRHVLMSVKVSTKPMYAQANLPNVYSKPQLIVLLRGICPSIYSKANNLREMDCEYG